jgi:hypothetical protein
LCVCLRNKGIEIFTKKHLNYKLIELCAFMAYIGGCQRSACPLRKTKELKKESL